jgi:hypothetical protein
MRVTNLGSCVQSRSAGRALVLLFFLAPTVAWAIPSINPHPHNLVAWEDPAGGGAGINHHHWDPVFPLYPGNGVVNDETAGSPLGSAGDPFVNISFDAYSAWDQNGNQAIYRNGDAVNVFGHGFIRSAVPYALSGTITNANMIADINASVAHWVTSVTGACAINAACNNPNKELGFNFAVGAAEDLNFDGMFNNGAAAPLLSEISANMDFNMDGDMLDMVNEDANGNGVLDGFTMTLGRFPGVNALWSPSSQQLRIDNTIPWFFGGRPGANPIPASEDLDGDGVVDPGEDLNGDGDVLDTPVDFFTIMMHELGHMIGLNHINSNEDVNGDGNLDIVEDLNGNGLLNDGIANPLLNEVVDAVDYNMDGDMLDMVNEDADTDGILDNFVEDLNGNGALDVNPGRLMDTYIGFQTGSPASPGVAGTFGVRTPDVGSLFGAMALYLQPVPEPTTTLLVTMAMLGTLAIRRKR